MYCSHLSLTNFRNYARLELELPTGATVVVGHNAQGKSNLLEAIYFLATSKSFRAGSDREVINWLAPEEETPFARLVARVQRQHAAVRIEIVLKEEGMKVGGSNGVAPPALAKRIKVNNVSRRAIDLVGQVNVVMFTPQDIGLVQGAPQLRRRYLDVTISQVDSHYCRSLAHYNRVLVQRNHLLRQIRDRHGLPDQLVFWDEELVGAGSYIALQRLETVAALNDLIQGIHRKLTGSQERLRIGCHFSLDSADGGGRLEELVAEAPRAASSHAKLEAIKDVFARQLRHSQGREILCGLSLTGPHRDDLVFIVDDRDMNVYGSRGQQRTVALSLKLAEAEFMLQKAGEPPILLLDDVMSELDPPRRQHVLATVDASHQVIITTSDLYQFDRRFLSEANLFRVANGSVEHMCPEAEVGIL
ncbi:MAG: DNA replication/repair protein RecF [Chloroflexi bacterium]|nr:DNA replication/repair protein RecF [Chloroflexota bacterium]